MNLGNTEAGTIDSREDFEKTPRGQYKYWMEEVTAAETRLRKWHKESNKIHQRYVDTRREVDSVARDSEQAFRLNLFHSNTKTLSSIIYGNLPKVDVSRRYADPDDDIGRVSGEMMERLLNLDIQQDGERYDGVLKAALQDRLLPGLGCARLRYEVETETKVNPETGLEEEVVSFEDAPVDYFHWRDLLWGWGRQWSELPWLSYRVFMNKDEVTEKWGEKIAGELVYESQKVNDNNQNKDSTEDPEQASVWNKAEVLEIWDKTSKKIIWMSKGYDKIIETKDDFLGLENFFPSPRFLLANPTTALFMPTPDWHMVKDLYKEVDRLQTRIGYITEAVKVVGVYDSSCEDSVARMLKEGNENELIPVKSWAIFAEKGGLDGSIQWMPLADIVAALDKLIEVRDSTIALLQRITGIVDVLRGEGSQYEGVGQTQIKSKNASIPIQALQEEFATFASGIMAIKAEIISKHYQPETIIRQSNIQSTNDKDFAVDAAQLIKMYRVARLKVAIRPESLAMVDYAELKQERSEYIMSMAQFWQSAASILKEDPEMKPFFLEIFQWAMAGLKGSSEIEGVLDKAISTAQKKAAAQQGQGKPDPKAQAMQMQLQLEQMKQKGELAKLQAKAQADAQARDHDMQADIQTAMAENQAKLKEIEAGMYATIAETKAKLEADLLREQASVEGNVVQTNANAEAEITKDAASTAMEIEKESAKTDLKINEIAASASAKITETKAAAESKSDDNGE